jgi:hypothetical protein
MARVIVSIDGFELEVELTKYSWAIRRNEVKFGPGS